MDLFTDFISFQETEPEVVANYARLVSGLGAPYLLLRNSPTGKPNVRKPVLCERCLESFPI